MKQYLEGVELDDGIFLFNKPFQFETINNERKR